MKYDLNNPLHAEQFSARTARLLSRGAVVELTERKPMRTMQQNKYLHVILSYFAVLYGESMDYVKQYFFKRLCNPDLFITERDDRYLGRVQVLRSTRDLTTDNCSLAIERFRDWSLKVAGIYLPSANEDRLLSLAEIEIDRNKRYY